MNQFGDLYSRYYDLLYEDKDYEAEVAYIDHLIKKHRPSAKTLLDLGCGTGRHAQILCDHRYAVHGVDSSEEMLSLAQERIEDKKGLLSFSKSDLTTLNLDRKFDVIVSLFHVMSYQNTNEALIQAFASAKNHLEDGGIFIFDFWYGPAVLTDLPARRMKTLENDALKITRISEPTMHAQLNVVDVHFNITIEDKASSDIIEKNELHKMRYFFDTELEMICDKTDFRIIDKFKWMSDKNPDFNS